MEIKELAKFLTLPNKHFEGHLVLNDHKVIWTLYFVQGRLIYAGDGGHPVRRWNRTLTEYFPKARLDIDPSQLSAQPHWQIYLLDQGFKQQQFSLVRAKVMLRAVIQECLFELSQCSYVQCEYQATELSISRFCRTIALSPWEIQMTLNKVKDVQRTWQKIDMQGHSPALSPALKKPVDPQRLPIPHEYITGRYTLWNIATTLGQSLTDLTQSLVPLIQEETLELKNIADLPLSAVQLAPVTAPKPQPSTADSSSLKPTSAPPAPTGTISARPYGAVTVPIKADPPSPPQRMEPDLQQPLIACIDDSPVLAHSLKKILATGGYRTLIIQEPMQGFSQLIEHIPSLILLDVMLPNADGYNICRFLRDTPVFKNTPIIILTGRSKPVDRARASMAGATEFLVKPPEATELLQMIEKHLGARQKISS